MKNLLKRLPKKALLAVATTVVAVVAFTAVGSALLGGDRPVKEYRPGVAGFDHVTFNSFTNVPNIGDERNFFTGKIAGAPNGFYDPMNGVDNGDEILMRVYVHNGADSKHNASGRGIARNTRVRVALPTGRVNKQVASAFVSADNAQPQIIEDTLTMNGAQAVQLKYVPGSVNIKSNFQDRNLGAAGDAIVNGGIRIGDDNVNGDVKGCFEYVTLVTFKVKVVTPSYSIQKSVRHEGGTSADWKESIRTEPGKTVEWRIEYKNLGQTETKAVKVVDPIDERLTVVPGSVRLINGNYPQGYTFPDSAIQANGRQINVNIGNYNTGINAFVLFKTKVVDEDDLKCGVNKIPNLAYATPEGSGSVNDGAEVVTDRTCEEVPNYSCDALELDKLGGRKISLDLDYTAENGAEFKDVVYDFGDGSDELVTDQTENVEYTYDEDGTYNITATVRFTVDGQERTDTGPSCEQQVTFRRGRPVPPTKPPVTELPNTGAGNILGIFAATTVAGALAHRMVWARRQA